MSQTCRVRQGQGIGGDKTKKRQQGDSSGALRNTLEICPCPLQVTLEQSTKSQGQVNHEEICVKSSLDTRNGKPSGLGVCQVQETKTSVRQAATAETEPEHLLQALAARVALIRNMRRNLIISED